MKNQNVAIYLPDKRGVDISRYGLDNDKIGKGVYTYSRLAIRTCPGSSTGCRKFCYAQRISGPVREVHLVNTLVDDVPPIPAEAKLLRLHVDGDLGCEKEDPNWLARSLTYIENWITRLTERPDVTAWAYTRSWNVPELLPALERLRALPNVQLFASMDTSMTELPPEGWRIAWIEGDERIGTTGLVCPEELGTKRDCVDCGYCFKGKKGNVIFKKH